MCPASHRRPSRVLRLPTNLLPVFLLLALICPAHAGVTVELVPGVYRQLSNPKSCPTSITIGAVKGANATLATLATSAKCDTGEIVMTENPTQLSGDNSTKYLVKRGVALVGTIVLASASKGVSCGRGAEAEAIKRNSILNFLRPRSAVTHPFKPGINFRKGEFYVILRSECFYHRAVPSTPGVVASPAPNSAGQQTGEQTPTTRSPNIWVWAGPLIGVGAIALVGLIALLASRRGKWYGGVDRSDVSDSAFFGSLSNSPRRPGSMHDTLPRENSGIVFEAADPEPPKQRKSVPES